MAEVIYNVAASLDGFLAPVDGSADWLAPFMQSGEDYGLGAFMASVEAVLMGSRTYEQALAHFGDESSRTPCFVFSSRKLPVRASNIIVTPASPREVVAQLEQRGIGRAWSANTPSASCP